MSHLTNSTSIFLSMSSQSEMQSRQVCISSPYFEEFGSIGINQPRVNSCRNNCLTSLEDLHDTDNEHYSESSPFTSLQSLSSESRISLNQRIQELKTCAKQIKQINQQSKRTLSSLYTPKVYNKQSKKSINELNNLKCYNINNQIELQQSKLTVQQDTPISYSNSFTPYYKDYLIEYV